MDIVHITPASDSSILVVLGDSASEATQQRVALLTRKLLSFRDARIRNVHPAYISVLIDFDPLQLTHEEIATAVRGIDVEHEVSAIAPRTIEIPVCYGHEFGLDLQDVAHDLRISTEEVIGRHAAGTYNVSFFGFSPGFAYLGGVADSLQVARLDSPRKLVQAGSVAIAGAQTGVYSVDSPGGWRVLGKTPWRMFAPDAQNPSPLEIGNRVRFVPITREDFERRVGETCR